MHCWKFVLAGSVCTALAFIPQGYKADKAVMPVMNQAPSMAKLKLQKVTPGNPFTSRAPISAFSHSNKPLDGIRICIDPGHGGQALTKTHYTGGTVGVATGQTESDVNLRVSLILREYLKAAGANVVMTRISDDRCQGDTCKRAELDFRSDIANEQNADFFVSVHHNEAAKKPGTNYTAVFYPQGVGSAISLAENVSASVSKYLGTQNIGAKIGDYRVLNRIKMPGVIVEASFMSCPTEDQRLAQLSYNKMEAKAIATGILNYVRLSKGRQVDFNNIFAPLDDQAGTAQMMADASFVRKQIVERRSLFGVKYEELTYDPQGNIIERREVGNSSLAAKKANGSKTSKLASAKSKIKVTASKLASAAKTTTAKTSKVVVKDGVASKKTVTTATSNSSTAKKPEVKTVSNSKTATTKKVADASASKTTKKPASKTTKKAVN